MITNLKNKKIIIKTYLAESGLWYLAKSLADTLIKNKNDVWFVPKSKYKLDNSLQNGRRFVRFYPRPYDPNLLAKYRVINFDETRSISDQIMATVAKNNIDIIISLETFMPKSEWILDLKKRFGTKIIDIPMPEWTSVNYIKNGSYSIFDEIWCLTKTSEATFSNYKQRKSITWDYVDMDLFNTSNRNTSIDEVVFYHPASVNPGFSQKNTDQVIRSFVEFYEKNKNSKLILTGQLTKADRDYISDCKGISFYEKPLDRHEVAKIYNKVHCLVAPSRREGLGLSFFEAAASGCDIITTDVDPMNKYTKYLCKPHSYTSDSSPVQFAEVNKDEILKMYKKYYEDFVCQTMK